MNICEECFGTWWFNEFNSCRYSNLNGKYYSGGKMSFDIYNRNILSYSGINWYSNGFSRDSDSLIFTVMKIRRKLLLT